MEITTVVTGAWNAFATKITAFLPELLGAVIVFVAGWLAARLVRMTVVKVLKVVRFDSATQKTGVQEFLDKGGVAKTPSEIIGILVYWFIMILVIIASLDALGLPIVSDLLNSIFLYIPNVVAAIIVIILGLLVGNLLSAVVRTAASNAGLGTSQTLGKIASYGILFFAGSIALNQLGVGQEIVASAFKIAFGAAAFGLALAFGLGGRDLAGEYLRKWLERDEE